MQFTSQIADWNNTNLPFTDQKYHGLGLPQSSYVNRAGIENLLTSFHQKKFLPSSFFNRFLYQTTWVNCFESCKESKLVNSVLSKGDLSFAYYQKTLIKTFFVPIIKQCLKSLQMSFKSFFLLSQWLLQLAFTYSSWGSQDNKILAWEKKGYSQVQNTKTRVYWQ